MTLLLILACGPDVSGKDSASTTSGTPAGTSSAGSTACPDGDGDGVGSCSDCDDADPTRYPGAVEACDGVDNDCDGALAFDEGSLGADGLPICASCDAAGFWLPTRELSGDPLWDAVGALTASQSCSSYSAAKDFLWIVLDREEDLSVECVYTGAHTDVWDQVPDGYSTEHTWPRSLGAESPPQECDLHHLFPTTADSNNIRSNYPLGEVSGDVEWSVGGSSLGDGEGGATVFEPRDAHKGNAARAMLYFAARYGHALSADEEALYHRWHASDPPDAREQARSLRIAREQGAANPFVVCTDLVDAL